MKVFLKITAIVICIMLFCGTAFAGQQQAADAMADMIGTKHGKLLADAEWFPAGNSVCDWLTIAFSVNGVKEAYADYAEELEAYVSEQYAAQGGLDSVKATEYHRVALTVLALGEDPTCFGTDTDGKKINLIADGTYNFSGEPGKQGLNGWIFALIALDAGEYEVPEDAKYTREDILENIIQAQTQEGGFGLSSGNADVDITAMALQALAPYREEYSVEVEQALEWLTSQMNENCGFAGYDRESAESIAQVIIALCALGIDPAEDERFCRGENTLLTGMERFRGEDGAYSHNIGEESDPLATAQALLAEAAVQKLENGGGSVYDFTDMQSPESESRLWIYILIGAAVAVVALAVIFGTRKGKKHEKVNE